ncbi:hypothetical protein IG631_18551 [Alternaria alternata]|nr:hypothetical protein IG631_18551 [Alternaria alternata]
MADHGTGIAFGMVGNRVRVWGRNEDRAVPGLRGRLGTSLDVPSWVWVGPMGCVAIGRRSGVGIDG